MNTKNTKLTKKATKGKHNQINNKYSSYTKEPKRTVYGKVLYGNTYISIKKALAIQRRKRNQALRTLELLRKSSSLVHDEVQIIFREDRRTTKRKKGDKGVAGYSRKGKKPSSIPLTRMYRCGRN